MNIDSSFLTYFVNAGLVVKIVLLLLVAASVASWTYIIQYVFFLKEMRRETTDFEEIFWSGGDLSKLYADTMRKKNRLQGMEAIFHVGFKEFLRLHKQPHVSAENVMDNARRAMRGAFIREQDKLETNLPLLSTVGSISPYVGLFGTVWGIMTSLRALSNVQQATIAMVAPGIAEALIATAIGLFAVIPAAVGYNRYTNEINRLLNRFETFQDEFANILFRQAQMNFNKVETVED